MELIKLLLLTHAEEKIFLYEEGTTEHFAEGTIHTLLPYFNREVYVAIGGSHCLLIWLKKEGNENENTCNGNQ